MTIPSLSVPGPGTLTHNAGQPFRSSTTQAQTSFEKMFIDITTREGDTITLQSSTSRAAISTSDQWFSAAGHQGVVFGAQSYESHSFSYTVQGDLNMEELKDLGELFDALSLIAGDFYEGRLDEAVTGALAISNLGSLSSYAATFSQSQFTAVQAVSNQPSAVAELGQNNSNTENLARQRQAQWQQILAYLEKRAEEQQQLKKKAVPHPPDQDRHLLTTIKETLERHPRLAHLAPKLADKAMTDHKRQNLDSANPGKKYQPSPDPKNQDRHQGQTTAVRV